MYDGERIVRDDDVIVVTTNYRLGPMGFLSSPSNGVKGNMGLLDQRAVMKWLQLNAAAFGGDPTHVTIWGESAGAGSVSCHMVMPQSWPYFSAAITESGPIAPWTARPQFIYDAVTNGLVKEFNCSSFDCLRSVDAVALMKARSGDESERAVTNVTAWSFLTWQPVVDGVDLVDLPLNLMKAGKLHRVPALIGSNLNEGTLFVRGMNHDANSSDLTNWMLRNFGPTYTPQVAALYPISDYLSPWWTAVQIITDSFMACPSRAFVRALTAPADSAPTYLYQFTHVIDEVKLFDKFLGVFHGSEMIFVFNLRDGIVPLPDHVPIPIVLSLEELTLAKFTSTSWVNFGTSHNPGSEWPLYNVTTDINERLDLKRTHVAHLKQKYCDFWDSINLFVNPPR